jgi:hypothetical protein
MNNAGIIRRLSGDTVSLVNSFRYFSQRVRLRLEVQTNWITLTKKGGHCLSEFGTLFYGYIHNCFIFTSYTFVAGQLR